ncbi:MAG: serine acetyltransferase [Hungatella sp.]|nr:serine acetyltransferase [Hungatella sp.]
MNFGNAINKYRRARWLYLHHLELFAWFIRGWIYLIHNSFIPYKAVIGEGTILGYKGIGIVIHSNAVIGKNCVIGTNVTIGGGGAGSNERITEFDSVRGIVPVIGDNVQISTGAKIIGNIVVGENAVIGANAVVISDVPAGAVVGGVPAKVLYLRDDIKEKKQIEN